MLDDRSKFEYLANQWISLWNSPLDLNLFDELHSDDFIDLSSSGRPSDKNGFKEGIQKLLNAFPDLQTNVDDILIDFEKAALFQLDLKLKLIEKFNQKIKIVNNELSGFANNKEE